MHVHSTCYSITAIRYAARLAKLATLARLARLVRYAALVASRGWTGRPHGQAQTQGASPGRAM